MKISYVTTYNARDIHSWSGLAYHLAEELECQGSEIEYIGDLTTKYPGILRSKELFYKIMRRQYLRDREPFVVKDMAAQVARRMSSIADIVLSPGTLPIAYLETKKPKVFYTDATFAGMIGFYESFSNLCAQSIKDGNEVEQAALSSCALAIYSSDWAAQTAIDNYNVNPEKVKVVLFGANIVCNRTTEDIKSIINQRSKNTCKLLFLGVDWERKGGDMALAITQSLNKSGLKTELHIAGIRSLPVDDLPENVFNHGFISKSTLEGNSKIEQLIAESHFLILPTKAEAYGLVFCEANSFGVPNIATRVGGIPTIVRDDINGRLFPLSAVAEDYAGYIHNLFNNYKTYEDLALSSFNEFQTRLNWTVACKNIVGLLENL